MTIRRLSMIFSRGRGVPSRVRCSFSFLIGSFRGLVKDAAVLGTFGAGVRCLAMPADVEVPGERRFALVLGAGGAVGLAYHAGTLRALEKVRGIDPNRADLVIGTSAGSVIGARLRRGDTRHEASGPARGGDHAHWRPEGVPPPGPVGPQP